jgi:phytoene dehydrogenase-like protein
VGADAAAARALRHDRRLVSDLDAVVVGSGPNGLSAAITLARAGRSVLVLEAASRYGGAVATEELTLPGFRHDTWSSVYPAAAASPVFASFALERFGLEWVHPRYAMAHVLGGDRAPVLSREVTETAASLEALHPGDGARWAAFVAPYLKRFDAVRRTLLGGFPPVRGALGLTRLGYRGVLEFARLVLMPAEALGEELFRAGGSRAWLYGSAMHGDVPPAGAGSAVAAAYLALLGHAVGWPSPRGGAASLADALVACLRAHGGEVRTSAPVERVEIAAGRTRGVVLAGGERIAAPLVIGDVTPPGLLRLAGDSLPGPYARALGRYRFGPSTLKVDWALRGPVPWSAPAARQAGTVHVGGSETEVLRATAHTGLPALADPPFMLFGQQSVADPTRAPAGRHTAWAYTHGPHGVDWEAERDAHVARMEARIEHFAPGFNEQILARHVQTPGDLERGDPNLVHGDVGAGSYALDQVIMRPVPSLAPYRTPVPGLYIGSASTFPGGAVHGVPGHAAARLALTEARIRRGGR